MNTQSTIITLTNGFKVAGVLDTKTGLEYFIGASTWHSDHSSLKMVKDGKVINEYNYHRELDETTPELLNIYRLCSIYAKN